MTDYQAIFSHDGIKFFKATGTGSQSDPYIPTINTQGSGSGGAVEFDNATNFAVTIGNTSTEIRAANASRKILALVNNSDVNIFISLGGTAALNSGIRLNANGGNIVIANPIYTGVVNGIAATAGHSLVGMEGT
jgi:hypothetical protein